MSDQYVAIDDTAYVHFASNTRLGTGDDGASAAVDVRQCGDSASGAPISGGATVSLLSHANYPAGCYEVALVCSAANGYAADKVYAIFCTLAVDSQNPTGFIGRLHTSPAIANIKEVNDDDTAAANLEAMYNGTGYTSDDTAPASRAQVDNIAVTGAAVNVTAKASPDGFVLTTGSEVNNEDATGPLDGTRHELTDTAGTLDAYYKFDIGGDGVPTGVTFTGVFNGLNDSWAIEVNTGSSGSPSWAQRGTVAGNASASNVTETFTLFANDVVSDVTNEVWVRINGTGLSSSSFDVDQVYVSKAIVSRTAGYEDGSIWVDDSVSNTNVEDYVDGTADNPVSTWGAALSLSSSLGIKRFHLAGGTSITLTGDSTGYQLIAGGEATVALGSQTVTNALFDNCIITGTGTGSAAHFNRCHISAGASIPAGHYYECGFQGTSGSPVTESGTGEYVFHRCFSEVAGSGTPYFNFAGAGGTVGINVRGWNGGVDWTLDSNCTLSHEVAEGGGTTITTGGADVEVRGITRALTVTMSAAETVQFVGITGPITLSGTTTGTVNLYGVSASLSDSTSGATVTDSTATGPDLQAVLADTADMQPKLGSPAGASISADIATVDSEVGQILADTGTDGVVVAAASKTGYRLSATGVDDVLDEVYEGTTTLRQYLRLSAAALFGKLSGAATTTVNIRDEADSKNRISATVDADGNRSAVTLDKT